MPSWDMYGLSGRKILLEFSRSTLWWAKCHPVMVQLNGAGHRWLGVLLSWDQF